MKRWTRFLACSFSVILAAGVAYAKPKGATPPKDPAQKKDHNMLVGTVLKVDGSNINLTTHGKNAGEITVVTDAKTQFEINGQASTLDKIKPGMQIVVTPNTGTAQKVVVSEDNKNKAKKTKGKKDATPAPTPPAK